MSLWNTEQSNPEEALTEKELTSTRAYEIARSMEAVHQESGQLQVGQQEQSTNVVVVEARNISPCWRCGKTGHIPDQCFFIIQSNAGSIQGHTM